MIIISNAVPKSASTLVMEYQRSLISESSTQNGMEEWDRYNNSIFIPSIQDEDLEALLNIDQEFGDLVIKTHGPPYKHLRNLVEKHGAKVTCCFRDPRDTVLSAMDHGVRTRNGLDKSGAFGNIHTIEDGAREFKEWVKIFYEWESYGQALMIKYETLMADRLASLVRIVEFLGMDTNPKAIREIHDEHERIKTSAWNFNKGTCYRWKEEMSPEQLTKCNDLLGEDVTRMGYSLG